MPRIIVRPLHTPAVHLWQVCLASFTTYVLVDPENNVLDSRRAFVALALFNALRFPLSMLPMITISAVQVT